MKPNNEMFRHFGSMVFLVVLALEPAATPWANATESGTQPPAPSSATLQSSYGKLPLSFEANHGQWDASVQFVTRGGGHTLFLTPSEAVLTLRTGGTKNQERGIDATPRKTLSSPSPSSYSAVRMRFKGTDSQAEMVGLEPLPGIVNYFIGDDPAKWRTNIPTYQKVEYKNLYAGIDLVYYGNQGHLEYDLVVAPGADPTQIRLAFDGAEQIAVDDQGDLVLTLSQSSAETAAPILRLYKPVVYQRDEQGQKHLLASSYVVRSSETATTHAKHAFWTAGENSHVTFQVASYDASKPLIIDPVLSWATYRGGNLEDFGGGIAVDQAGQAYVTGTTLSSNFPGTAGSSLQSTFGGGPSDAFVIKLNALGTAIIYSIYLGGSGIEEGRGITVDTAGNAYVTGDTGSFDFPGTAGSPIQSVYGGGDYDAFVIKLNATGASILYSTYLGGGNGDIGNNIIIDQAGQAYVTGLSGGPGFPVTIPNTCRGNSDAFVTKLNAAGTSLVYSTCLGGNFTEEGTAIAIDREGNAYVTGLTDGTGFPGTTSSPIQNAFGGGPTDAFVTKLNASGTAILYSTYLGGSGRDGGFGIAVDADGYAYVTGHTSSPGFPGTAGSFLQPTLGGDLDAFVTKLNPSGTALVYSTYLGGNGEDQSGGVAIDGSGQAYVTGGTASSNFPGAAGSSIQSMQAGGGDAFITKLNAAGTGLVYSTYLGGSGVDQASKIAVDLAGNAYVAGNTSSPNFPGTVGSPIQNTKSGGNDAFVAKITSSTLFTAFDVRAKIDVHDRGHHGRGSHHRPHHDDAESRDYQRQDDDEFKLVATFTLGPGSNGSELLKEAVMIQVGTFSTAIPAGSFKQHKGRFVFEGMINGMHLEAMLRSLILGNDYELKVEGHGADLTGTVNPVPVSVTIGDDSGNKAITAKIK